MKGDWREDLKNAQLNGERLEKRARDLGIADLPFSVYPHAVRLEWAEWEKTLADFRDRVLMVAKMIGRPPDTTLKSANDGTVILKARWFFPFSDVEWERDTVAVEAYSTTNCRVIVGDEELKKVTKPRVHPECVEVVDRLEDLDEADWKDAPTEYAEAAL